MDNKNTIESIMKHRFFISKTGYPIQNGFLDYGPPLTQIKIQIIKEFRKIFVDETTYEIEPSAILPYEVLKNSGHIDKFCDVILTDNDNIYRADHFIEEKVGEYHEIPVDLFEKYDKIIKEVLELKNKIFIRKTKLNKKTQQEILNSNNIDLKNVDNIENTDQLTLEEVNEILYNFKTKKLHISDCKKYEIDFIVILNNLHSENNKSFSLCKDFNLILKINDRQFLRPEIAQSQFTNFRRLFDCNNEKLPFSSLSIGRSYRNEISARGGMLRTKEFEQAEIEYFSENGDHERFESIRSTIITLISNTMTECIEIKIGDAYEKGIIKSQAICYFIAKSINFLLNIGFNYNNIRFRQHKKNEMAHYAADCWDIEIKTLSGWIECAGIADRTTFDLNAHHNEINVNVKRFIKPRKHYSLIFDKKKYGELLKEKIKSFINLIENMSQEEIISNMKNEYMIVKFENLEIKCIVKSKNVDYEFFIPRVVEPSFGISRILYALVEQGFKIRDERNVLSLKPKMCYLHCVISFLRYHEEYKDIINKLSKKLKENEIRFQINERKCSIGRKYSSCDEIGVSYFITFDSETLNNNLITLRDRDSTSQIRIPVEIAPEILRNLINEKIDWNELALLHGLISNIE